MEGGFKGFGETMCSLPPQENMRPAMRTRMREEVRETWHVFVFGSACSVHFPFGTRTERQTAQGITGNGV